MIGCNHAKPLYIVIFSVIFALGAVDSQSAATDDPSVYDIWPAPFTMNNEGVMVVVWSDKATVFREDEKVGLKCDTSVQKTDEEKYNFPIYFYVDGALFAQLSGKDILDPSKMPVWTAKGVGTHTLECRMKSNIGSKANDSANVALIVKPYIPGEPGVFYPLTFYHGLEFSSPTSGQRFVLRPDLKVNIKVTLHGAEYFASYTKSTPYDELWHIEIVRRGSGPMSATETLVVQDSGVISASPFGTTLGEWFMANAGAGQYVARAYISQKRPDGYFVTASERVEFEVVAPLTRGNAGLQGVQSSPAVTPAIAAQPGRSAVDQSTQRSAAAASSIITQVQRAAPGSGVFEPPLVDGKRVDLCLHWGSGCGQAAADAFCQKSGYSKATEFKEAPDIGAQSPTLVLGDGTLCAEAYCDGFALIHCVN